MKAGEILKKHRKAQGLTQSELANKLGVTQSAIGKFESGDRQISLTMMYEIQDVLKDDFLLEILGFDTYEEELQSNIIHKFCDLYETGIYGDNGDNYCFIHNDNKRYCVEQSKVDALYKRFIQHFQIEFDAFLESIDDVVPENFEEYMNDKPPQLNMSVEEFIKGVEDGSIIIADGGTITVHGGKDGKAKENNR